MGEERSKSKSLFDISRPAPGDRRLHYSAPLYLYAGVGCLVHAVFMIFVGLPALAVLLFLCAAAFLFSRFAVFRGHRLLAMSVAFFAIGFATFPVDYLFGWNHGTHFFFLCAFPIIIGAETLSLRMKASLTVSGLALFIVMHHLILHVEPTVFLSPELEAILVDVNLIAAFGALSFTMSHYSRAAVFGELLQRRTSDAAHRLARMDPLTGIANRRRMEEILDGRAAESSLSGKPFVAAVADLDDFKRVNDTHGHAVGDQVLKAVALAAHRTLRNDDVVGRWGGEEFLLVLPGADQRIGAEALNRFRAAVEALEFEGKDARFSVTVTIGCAEWTKGLPVEDLIKLADDRLYFGKSSGKNRVVSSV